MEVRKGTDGAGSWRERGRVLLGAVALVAALSTPALVVPGYPRVVSTALVLAAAAGASRLLVAAAVALPPASEPRIHSPERLPDVTVVVTAYDEADVLHATLAACRNLAYPRAKLEILVCYEAASTDGTAAIADAAATRDRRVDAVAKGSSPAGKAAITNLGLSRATGEVIAVLDADQRLRPDALRRAVAHLQRPGVRCVTGRRVGTNPADSLVALYATVEHHLAERVEFVARSRTGGFALFTGGQAFFEAGVFDDLGPFDETVLLEDVAMACRIHAAGGTVHVDPGLVSLEDNPATFSSWWHQRVRWARGGMQVARQACRSFLAAREVPWRVRVDAGATFGGLLAVPLLAAAAPSLLLGLVGTDVSPLLPARWPAVVAFAAAVPALVSGAVLVGDVVAGRSHEWPTFVAAATLPAYLIVQVLAICRAFVEEFVLGRDAVYVTS